MSRLLTVLAALSLSTAAFAGTTASHTVTVDVQAINEVVVSGGNVTLTINTATAGSEPDAQTDTSTSLAWTSNSTGKKITAETDVAAPAFTLTVEATAVSGGTSAGPITLSTTAQSFVTGVATTTGGATLSYGASATASDGTGTEAHTVVYTITDAA